MKKLKFPCKLEGYIMRLKICLLILFVCLSIHGFSQLNQYKVDSVKLVSTAYNTLRFEMKKRDFKKLDWQNVMVDTLPEYFNNQLKTYGQIIKPILAIRSKKDGSKILLYTEQDDKKYMNWINLNLRLDSGHYTGKVQTVSLQNMLLKTWAIKKDQTITSDKIDSVDFENRKIHEPLPNVLHASNFIDSNNKSFFVLTLSAYYLLFNESLKEDDPLANIYIFISYNALYYDFLLGHMSSRQIEGKLSN